MRISRADRVRILTAAISGFLMVVVVVAAAAVPVDPSDSVELDPSTGLHVKGMTFVGSRGEASELVVRATTAIFFPESGIANLVDVRAVVTDGSNGKSFEMRCDRAKLNVETNDFTAIGNVEGVTESGQRYSAPWVRYVHETAVLLTDASVTVVDQAGTLRGDGFRYYIEERRFKLLGNVSVEQGP
jgi:LPS export ABC transporter protein LptC